MQRARILIVEDETIVALDIQDRLRELGYDVAGVAGRGEEALELAAATLPDLVLMDIRLKGNMDGIETAERMRQGRRIPVVYLTAFSEESTLQRAKVTEPFGYIIKPFEDREIQSTIEMALYKHQAEQGLRESEERYRALFDRSLDCVFLADFSGRFLDANQAALDLLGYRREEIPTLSFASLLTEEQLLSALQMVEEIKGSGLQKTLTEYRLRRKDGTHVLVETQSSLIYREGKPFAIQGIARNITERKLAEEKLTRQTTLFRNLFEGSPEAIAIVDSEDCVVEVNQSFESLFGYSQVEARGQTINALLAPEPYLDDARNVSRAVIGDGRIVEKEAIRCTKDGRPVDVLVIGYPIIVDGRKTGAYAIYRDITERKLAEEELKKAHQTFLAVLEGIDATVYVADMHTHEILFMNKNMIDAFGGDLTGRICHEVFRGETDPCGHCTNDRLLDADGRPAGVCVWETKNPVTGKWYINHDRAIRWVDGRIVRLQIATDITMLKEMEAERNRIGEQFMQAQKMESVGRLAGGVAHDFNNMLAAILGHAELGMMRVGPTHPIYRTFQDIQDVAQRSAELTRQLLAFARRQTVAPKVLDLNDTVVGMLKMLQRLIGEDIDLLWKPGPALWPVRIDPSQIDQILANLCVNARDAIAGVGELTIETKNTVLDDAYCVVHPGAVRGPYVMLAVSDTGVGMSKDILDKIFEPFFTTKEIGKGTGLGLATVYGIVKQNEGFINVYSELGKGSTFKIYLPRYVGDTAGLAAEPAVVTPRGRGEKILLVEDEAIVLDMARRMLEELGYVVLTAGTPSEALREAHAHAGEIQLLMTDVVMPEMNGRDLAQSIRGFIPGLKCIFTSGYTADVIAHRGVLDHGVNFLQKPFSLKDLGLKVREVLESDTKGNP